jgi:hypothetical protein
MTQKEDIRNLEEELMKLRERIAVLEARPITQPYPYYWPPQYYGWWQVPQYPYTVTHSNTSKVPVTSSTFSVTAGNTTAPTAQSWIDASAS